jgi:hypothetical protein
VNATGRIVRVFPLESTTEAAVAGIAETIRSADLVVMVVVAGGDARAAAAIGRICSDNRIMTTSIVIRGKAASEQVLSETLAQVRPWSLMVVVVSDESYVDDILRSFR